MYEDLRRKVDTEHIDEVNREGHQSFFLFNNSESRLWGDGAKFYRLSYFRSVPGFLKFEEQSCECHLFIELVNNTYSESFIESNPLVIMWLIQNQLKCTYINQMFDKNYVLLSEEELTNFVRWLLKRKEEFESNGIDCIQQIYHECLCRNKFKISEPPVVTVLHPDVEIVEAIADDTIPMESEDDIVSCSGIDHCGEFYLEPNEWEKLCRVM